MSYRPVNIDRDTPLLLPPDLRDWVPQDDLVHFVIEVVERVPLGSLRLNHQGSGSAQYPPRMMLGLLIYAYALGVFSSRRIERATYRDVGVRFLTGDTHPDHDTICAFRRHNFDLVAQTFLHLLKMAREVGLLKVGTISVDGTHIQANASKHKSVGYERAGELEEQLRLDIAGLLAEAEKADTAPTEDGQRLPEAIARREKLLEKMAQARRRIEEQDQARCAAEQAEHEAKLAKRREAEGQGKPPGGAGGARRTGGAGGAGGTKQTPPEPPPAVPSSTAAPAASAAPSPTAVTNLTDPDSRLMRKSHTAPFTQSYNMQAAVDVGSLLILAAGVTQCANDSNQLAPMVHAVDPAVGRPTTVLADTGYMNAEALEGLEKEGFALYVAVGWSDNHGQRTYDYRPRSLLEKTVKPPKDPRLLRMREKLQTPEGREMYNQRKETAEPVFGIIKSAMGFRQCLLRGLDKVKGEWSLTALAYNFRRLWNLKRQVAAG